MALVTGISGVLMVVLQVVAQTSYQEVLDQTFERVLTKGISPSGTLENTDLADVPEAVASQEFFNSTLTSRYFTQAQSRLCRLRSQSGRSTTVESVVLVGAVGVELVPDQLASPIDNYFVLSPTYGINLAASTLQRMECVGRQEDVQVTIKPPPALGESDILDEGVPIETNLGGLIQQCDGGTQSFQSDPELCQPGTPIAVTIQPRTLLSTRVLPTEVVELTYGSNVYLLQVFTVVALACEALYIAFQGRNRALRNMKGLAISPERWSGDRWKWRGIVVFSVSIAGITAILSAVELTQSLEGFTRGYVTCTITDFGYSAPRPGTNRPFLSSTVRCEIIRVLSDVAPSARLVLLGPLIPLVILILAVVIVDAQISLRWRRWCRKDQEAKKEEKSSADELPL
mmetsp:Transcript_46101/g.113096  ORF Transcript_46101/g.113096 Transcript_46101/m.113096 type:complete len:400 (+) Transcript_46101:502-1701(+)|eukprot:CAMPEP_0198353570 /NCGR_PEP_ID=MMETSP1450-20131203/111858_1 /TAXON_ID=753684 ORGANISM="Madagascaria erythrocladiodes, Strain CCMP3234" /NCGR_SAMPLE_ID=MMETSP1450 /ASSEMBLY_ACC=CAM_ASM_001115 /LENGTH=399 /DNA_ID=CAMNT_0044059721 /DNA_START=481 /DNA_END=1680 /DNA_ORIENTATION=+